MVRQGMFALAMGMLLTLPVLSQTSDWRFRWKKGAVWTYQVSHVTTVTETVAGNKLETYSKLDLTKRWYVVDVDDKGVGNVRLTVLDMRHEKKLPTGDQLLFDSANPAKSTPEMKDQMAKYMGSVLADLRVNPKGQVVEVIKGNLAKYQAEPPFTMVLPGGPLEVGKAWVRPFTVTMDPPFGTGEKVPVKQKYSVDKVQDGKAVVGVVTEFSAWPENPIDQLPLLQREVAGKIQFNFSDGVLEIVRLNVDRTVENHQGKGSTYRFVSKYREDLLTK